MSATTGKRAQRRSDAAAAFNEHHGRDDGSEVVSHLAGGLRQLSAAMFMRIHADVEQTFGVDSMLLSSAGLRGEERAEREIDLYQVAESAAWVRKQAYVGSSEWYLEWLAALRFGTAAGEPDVSQTLSAYFSRHFDERKRMFADALHRVFPESRHAPIVLFQLFPLAVVIVTATAFHDAEVARQARERQVQLLPVIADCRACHGRLLEAGETCAVCGNPLWKYSWLTAE